MLECFENGKVYEAILITRDNATPVGVVRNNQGLSFKLFEGKSFVDIMEFPFASIQITNDVELLIRLALNMPAKLKFYKLKKWRFIEDLPGVYGRVKFNKRTWNDEFGESIILDCLLIPEGNIKGSLPLKPLSRADYALLEMAIHFTRIPLAVKMHNDKMIKTLHSKIHEEYALYKHLGGKSELAEFMMASVEKLLHKGVL
ncbi:DUF447 domain-containing protein [Thermococcus sp.]